MEAERSMKSAVTALSVFAVLICGSSKAKEQKAVNVTCEQAIRQAQVAAAKRKWFAMRPDPTAPTLNVSTHGNFSKNLVPYAGVFLSHTKNGTLVFEDADSGCAISSNGHPADAVLGDLQSRPPTATEAAKASPAQTASQAATTQATVIPAPVQAPSQARAVTTPQGEPLGDVARRLRAQKAAKEREEPPNDKP
ncbi:MAG: hypothetical protein WCD04_17225 [Terriglobia bacterium]|jgi:hypothetical protein